ncbi:MAG TPA: dolichyl-phosphate beta-glucosyltransferase [Anaerolineae bacterium]|nr:dolichyl-phosphate beta-glucosyltransferase [Anaerolineae bacterium]
MTIITQPFLSIIIPAYNEALRLPASLNQIAEFIVTQNYPVEVIVVNNNSRDATPQIAEEFAAEQPYACVLHEPRQGKGAAVRTGMLAARGEYLFICDADLSMPIEEIGKFMPPAIDSYDVAIASREAPGARRIGEPQYRHLMGRVFNTLVRVLAIPHIQDTQCGFKVFRREAAHTVFPLQTIEGWGFDVEVLFIALRRGYRLVEVPITWYYRPQTKINPLRDSINMVTEVLRVRLNGWRGVYDERKI